MQRHFPLDSEAKHNWAHPKKKRKLFGFDVLLVIFLLVSMSFIFVLAALGVKRDTRQWLSVNLTSRISGDYGVDIVEIQRLPPVNPQIIEAIKQDAQAARLLASNPDSLSFADSSATPTAEPRPTSTPTLTTYLPDLTVNAGGPYEGSEGSPISLIVENMDYVLNLVPGSITYQWDLDNDGRYDDTKGIVALVLYYDEGIYPVSVQATDWIGRVATDTTTVNVTNVAPLVEIMEVNDVNEAEKIVLQAEVSDPGHDILLYEWDFGDGSVGAVNTLSPDHTYNDNGDYTVRLRVRDNDDGVTEDFRVVSVENIAPIVDAGLDQVVNEGTLANFSGTATDPAGEFDTLTYSWDLDYDGVTFTPDAFGSTSSVYYGDGPATAAVALRVEDEDGGQTIDVVNVTVNNVVPSIASVTDDSPAGEGSPVTLQVRATDVGSDTLTYAFDWDNNGAFEIESGTGNVSNIWYDQGDYPVGIRATDDDGGGVFTTTVVSAFNVAPTAVAGGPGGAQFEGSTVQFTGVGSSDPGIFDVLTYTWRFGDGSVASGINVSHVYADNNVYSVTLTVADDSGDYDTALIDVEILNANPIAEAGPDYTVTEGEQVAFDGDATDPGPADTLTFAWDFDYDGITFDEDATGPSAQTIYFDGPAIHDVALRVRDDDYPYPTSGGEIGEHIDTLRITVQNTPPTVDALGPYTGIETVPIPLAGIATDVGPDVFIYEWDVDNDGTYDLVGQSVTNIWNMAGVYTVTLRATDDDGDAGFDTAQVTVNNAPPTAEAGGPYVTTVNLPVTLSGAGSSDPTNDPLTYRWDFGDGTPIVITNSITVTHVYLDDDNYSVTLQVDDGRGGTDTDTAIVTVNNLPPTASAGVIPNFALEGAVVTFDGSGSSDPGIYDTLFYQWNFGDGTPVASGMTVTHTYDDDNIYTAVLTVTDDGGAIDTDTVAITILNADPTAVAGASPTTALEGVGVMFDGSGSSDAGSGDTLSYQWNFGDGSPIATGVTVIHTYADNNVYNASLTVRDDDGGRDTDRVVVTILNANPTARAVANPNPVPEGASVTLDGGGSSDPGSGDTFIYQWDYDYDGSSFDVDGTGQNVVTSYPDGPASYTIALRVRDDDYPSPSGEIGEDVTTIPIAITNALPTVDTGGPYTTTVGVPITLTGSGSDVPTDPLTYTWDLDDDGLFETPGQVVTFTGVMATGVYTVGLRVEDDDGGTVTDTTTVQVSSLILLVWPGVFYWLFRGKKTRSLRVRSLIHKTDKG